MTLITGDRVHVDRGPDGASVVTVEPGPGRRSVHFLQRRTGRGDTESLEVVPADAATLIEAGRLDARLFDVAALIRRGLDDERASSLPLIVRARGPGIASLGAGARSRRALPSLGATVVTQEKASTGVLWASLTAPGNALAPGVEKVWLDGIAHPVLAESAPQVGAPAAWQAGLTGQDVTVAVLDTGVDATHPDLQGRVIASRDFTDTSPEAADDVGHGTHVAGIIAGSGAASDGRYRGVASGASILNGKVCVFVMCLESDIIAGMEWAAANARVVNMSLGGEPTDGSDPMSQALDALSEEYGTLFVVAAGNDGPFVRVGTPGAATRALTVASVTKADTMSDFSSPGPRFGDSALKPDIAAPGEDIVAARARGTEMGPTVDYHYTMVSGTSMATPHVAAAAAIVAQAHPDWNGERIKEALMSSAHPIAATIYQQGAGRLDVARAIEQPVRAGVGDGSFGLIVWPHEGAPLTRTITLHNDGDTPVVLDLALRITDATGAPAPEGTFSVDAPQVSIAARGSQDVTVTMRPVSRTVGVYGGWLEATGGPVRVVVAVGAEQQIEHFDLTLRQTWRDGTPAVGATAHVMDLATGQTRSLTTFDERGVATMRVPRGVYDVIAFLDGPTGDEPGAAAPAAILVEADVSVAAPTTVALDAARARRFEVTVDRPDAVMTYTDLTFAAGSDGNFAYVWAALAGNLELYMTTMPPVTSHQLVCVQAVVLQPSDPAPRDPYRYDLVFVRQGGEPSVGHRVRDRDLARVDARYYAQGTPVSGRRQNVFVAEVAGGIAAFAGLEIDDIAMPSRRTEYFTVADNIEWTRALAVRAAGAAGADRISVQDALQPGRTAIDWNRAPIGPAGGTIAVTADTLSVSPGLFAPGQAGQNELLSSGGITGSLTVRRGDAVLGQFEKPSGRVTLPPGRARYTIDIDAQRAAPWSALESRLDVTWGFDAEPIGPGEWLDVPVMAVRASGPVDGNSVAPAAGPYVLTLQVEHQTGSSRVTELDLDVSYDDGATWRRAPVVRVGNTGFALLFHPRQAGAVSLRVHARDAAGTTLDQTVIQSYRIAP